MRVPLLVLALVVTPLAVGAAQGQSGGNANANADNRCKNSPQAGKNGNSQAGAAAAAQAQLHKNCSDPVPVPPPPPPPPAPVPPPAPPPPPPPAPPPPPSDSTVTGIHKATGIVFNDLDGSGSRDMFSGENGMPGWTVQLFNASTHALLATASTDASGYFMFSGLTNGTYDVCVVAQTGYMQTWPTIGNACDGLGYEFSFDSTIETWATNNDFGELASGF
ncbi:MAG TPA: SdrD B-like domain-containing protein [Gemmatimonadales bacterium]|nr:SdrD B-like domain-containing protein [Gemmatimonadales bacterium]